MFGNSKHTDKWKPQQKIGLTLRRQRLEFLFYNNI